MRSAKLLLVIAMIILPIFSIGLKSNPPEECLKLAGEDGKIDSVQDKMTGEWEYYEHRNPDSIMVDTCQDSPTFGQFYAKKTFELFFNFDNYPLNTILDTNEVVNVDIAQFSTPEFASQFQELKNKFGSIYLKGLDKKYHDSTYKYSPLIKFYFENYQNIDSVKHHFKDKINSLRRVKYEDRSTVLGWPTSILENEQTVFIVYPNPANTVINLNFKKNNLAESVQIRSLKGELIKSVDYSKQIDISDLPTGVYFVIHANQICKFIKE